MLPATPTKDTNLCACAPRHIP
uniref:Uncharacterized protein n=1 Tax=Rhizophora mucronata TaxID=61149 RepID=A0A2P2Q1R4_RHIMU